MRFYLTTAIDYVNSRPHLGTAYEKITADVVARYKRLAGYDTHFLMGNDEHSQNVFRRAKELGEEPLAYCDRMEQVFREVWARLDISFDDFIRTTEPRHRAGVQHLVRRSAEAGDVYEGTYEGWYCVSCESFKQEKDLTNGLCPIHLTRPDWIREQNYFFRLSKYRDALLAHFDAHPDFLLPEIRRNEILRLLEGGLEDISISRAGQSWGIPLPIDPQSVVYVWFDALINYASAVGYGTDAALFARRWPADLHIVGKDITRFHTVFWPAMLLSAGEPLPRQVFGHGWVHFKGQKMSKSLGTVVDPLEAADRVGPDPLRLYLVKEIAFGGDGDFSWERFEERYNVDLANNLGNLVSRVSTMTERYRGSRIAASPLGPGRLAGVAADALAAYRQAMDRFALHEGAAAAFRLVDATNEFLAESEPWTIAREDAASDRLTQVLFDAAEAVRVAGVLLLPIMPRSAQEILRRAGEPVGVTGLRLGDAEWKGSLARTLTRAPSLWPRLVGEVEDQPARAGLREEQPVSEPISATPAASGTGPSQPASMEIAPPAAPAQAPPAAVAQGFSPAGVDAPAVAQDAGAAVPDARLSIDDFMRVELRVAKVLSAERVPKSKKLLKLRVDVGSDERTLVAGIAEAYEPDALVGRTVVIVANLKPATLMGVESNGMVLAASPDGGKPELVSFVAPPPPGFARPMIDSHCHLADDAFEADAEAVIGRAVAAGVTGALCIVDAGSLEERSRALDLVRAWPGLRVSIGVHPHQAAAWTLRTGDALAEVATAIAGQPAARAVGEVGLDYHYDLAPRDVQRDLFAAQLALARERRLPVVIHAREADEDTVAIVREAGGDVRGVMHCFTGSTTFARQALDLGLHVSVAGILTFPKAEVLREVARYIPADRLLVETDSPFLAPVPFRGKRNEPAWVVQVAERLAEVRGVSRTAIDELTSRNFVSLFEGAAGAGALYAASHVAPGG